MQGGSGGGNGVGGGVVVACPVVSRRAVSPVLAARPSKPACRRRDTSTAVPEPDEPCAEGLRLHFPFLSLPVVAQHLTLPTLQVFNNDPMFAASLACIPPTVGPCSPFLSLPVSLYALETTESHTPQMTLP